MSPLILVIFQLLGLFLIVNETVFTHRKNTFKYAISSVFLLASFGSLFASENPGTLFSTFFLILSIASGLFLVYLVYETYQNSTRQSNYAQIFIESLKSLKSNIFLIVNEREEIMDISDSFLEDMGLTKTQVVGKNFMMMVNQTLRFTSMNEQSIDNDYLEQYYLRFVSVYQAQAERQLVLEYYNYLDQFQTITVTEKPILVEGKYKGRLLAGEKITERDATQFKIQALDLQDQLKDVSQRFETLLKVATEGLFFETHKTGEIWGNDTFKSIVGLGSNITTKDRYRGMIHPNDLEAYDKQMALKESKKKYKASYRLHVKDQDVWVIDQGQVIITPDGPFTVSSLQMIDQREIIRKVALADHVDYRVDLHRHIQHQQFFWVVRINLDDVKDLNATYGREATNHLVDEYLKRLKKNYTSAESKVYELDKYEYAIIMQNERDTSIVYKGLMINQGLFDYEVTLGGMTLSLTPSIGIIKHPEDASNLEEIMSYVEKAVLFAAKDIVKYNYCFYQDLQDVL
jgi:GGDEF domain-containing protein/PAS domain-containing protein